MQTLQGQRKLPEGGAAALLDQSGDVANIEARQDENSTHAKRGKNFFAFISSYQDGLSWHFRTVL